MPNFVFIVDGEVATNYFIPEMTAEEMESNPARAQLLNAMASNPIVIKTDEQIPYGHVWDGVEFKSPNPVPLPVFTMEEEGIIEEEEVI